MQQNERSSSNTKGALAFINHEATGGIILLLAALSALVIANSPFASFYTSTLETHLSFGLGALGLNKSVLHWINDGLMTIFFFLVGCEIKREFLFGELSSAQKALFPCAAALGGMIMPGLLYVALNWGNPETLRGWAIPTATDIAFATGVLALLGTRVPVALKIFLLALAIIDDLGAIIIIAVFYTAQLSFLNLVLACVGVALLILMNMSGIRRIDPYLLIGIVIWFCVLHSGVHATLAGVATAFALPFEEASQKTCSKVVSSPYALMETLHPWVTFLILPLFALANAGVSLSNLTFEVFFDSVPLGIALGLVLGKPIGIVLMSWLTTKARIAALPESLTWFHILGVGFVAGIGFTMSLFIGNLAFQDATSGLEVRLGVLGGSCLAAAIGFILLSRLTKKTTTS